MGLIDWVRFQARAFVLGSDISRSDMGWGKDTQDYQPPEYADYQATSNGVYACSKLRSDLLASLPLRLYTTDREGGRTEVVSGRLYELLKFVNPFWTWNRLIRMTELSMCIFGESYWFVERGESGMLPPREIWWARPDKVRIVPDRENYISHFLYKPDNGEEDIRFEPSETVWMPLPNIKDEFEGLAPLAAARLAADTASAALKSNRNLFAQGLQMGGMVMPAEAKGGGHVPWTVEQRDELTEDLNQKYKGVQKAHKWGVFRTRIDIREATITPKDAEFLGLMKWSLEDICRAYQVPLDLIGGQRTYENYDAAMKAMWTQCVLPEAIFIADELEERFLPATGEADAAEFDASGVPVLQEDREKTVNQMHSLHGMGVPLNPLLSEFMPQLLPKSETGKQEGYPWGDTWWAPMTVAPVGAADPLEEPIEAEPEETDDEEPRSRHVRVIEYDSQEHRRLWRIFARRTERWEDRVAEEVSALFRRQRDSVVDKIKAEPERALIDKIFSKAQWIKVFRQAIRPILGAVANDFGDEALTTLGLEMGFDVNQPASVRFLEQRAQRFAKRVNDTTWVKLQASLAEGMGAGESTEELAERVEDLFTSWYRKTGDTEMLAKATRSWVIARTEVIGASNGGTLLAWKQSDVVDSKTWLAALDERTRVTHTIMHGQTVMLGEDFESPEGATGPAPGQMGEAGEDINCRCTMTAGIRF
tara:strand:+ start:1188 stop:3302 length:2115 start_codon:yes stop_codon:yes gene_type:complete